MSNETAEQVRPKWEQARIQLTQTWTAVKTMEERIIQEGPANEVNPWLERTGWEPYLAGLDPTKLVQCVSAPDEEEEPINAAIWQIMDELIQNCQHSVIHHVGVFVRLEAIRTEKHQTRYHPLQPYMDTKGFAKYGRPWKQILMFIARTQEAHDWRSPPYQLTATQSRAWEILVREAEKEAEKMTAQRDESGRRENINSGSSNTTNSNSSSSTTTTTTTINDNNTSSSSPTTITTINSNTSSSSNTTTTTTTTNSNTINSDDSNTIYVITDAHKACLQFCYELLQQRITRREYDSALVYALAVLGVKSDGWMGVNQYPPILSAVIKISRFMIVQQALELEKDEEEEVESRGFVGCLTWVKRIIDRFMVRGSHSPM
jgi:hypothetical protein